MLLLGLRKRPLPAKKVDEEADRGERCLQLVGHVGDKRGLLPHELHLPVHGGEHHRSTSGNGDEQDHHHDPDHER